MDFSTNIEGFNTEFNLNAIRDYNSYLQGQASFDIETDAKEFARMLETAAKSTPFRDKNDSEGMGSFMDNLSKSLGSGLNAVNHARFEADRMQEDIAIGGPTSIHDAMIAAEKAELSVNMAIQIRNRILNAYSEINSMSL